MKGVPTSVLRTIYRAGHPVARVYWRVTQPRKRGVKCVLTRGDEVLLVRHTYGPGIRWELPGGGVKRGEDPRDAARREAREELGLEIADWRPLGDLFARIDGKRDTLWCFAAPAGDRDITPDGAEIAEARWFRRDDLPAEVHDYVARTLAL